MKKERKNNNNNNEANGWTRIHDMIVMLSRVSSGVVWKEENCWSKIFSYLSANTPAAAEPVTMPAKWLVPTKANQYWFSLHVIDHSSTMVFSYLSYTQRSHAICFFWGSSRPHTYDELPASFGSSYRIHCSGVNNPLESVVPGTAELTHGSL